MPIRQESGYKGQLVSLSGLLGAPGRGRQVEDAPWVVPAAETVMVLSGNGRRIAAVFQNLPGSAGDAEISLGENSGKTEILQPGDSWQIDINIPWTDSVWCYSLAGCTLLVTEICIP